MEHGNGNETFVGRERQREEFLSWLTNRNPNAPWILSVYDAQTDPSKQGGVGKTRLLRKFSDLARQTFPNIVIAYIDFFNIADRDGTAVAQKVVTALKGAYPEWNTSRSEENMEKYSSALSEEKKNAIADDARGLFADALIADFHALKEKLNDTGKQLLIFFDTFELLEEVPLTAVLRPNQEFPDDYDFSNIGVVIAGRNKINFHHSNWRGREEKIQNMPVSPFTPLEIREYFAQLSNMDISLLTDEDIQALYERTDGRPILIGLVNDALNRRRTTLKDLISISKLEFEANLISKICELDHTVDIVTMFMSHVYHRFNFSMLDWISSELKFEAFQDLDLEKTTQELLNLSFVRRPSAGEDFVLHDEMRPLVNRYAWDMLDPDLRYRILLSQSIIKYYEHTLQHTLSEQLKWTYTAELLYHKLYVDLSDGYAYFSQKFSETVNLRLNSFSRSMLREVQSFKKRMLPTQLWGLKFDEARLLQKEEDAVHALNLCLELEQEADPQWLEEHSSNILFEKGVAYQQLSRYPEAITSFTSSMDIEKKHGNMSVYADTLNWVGSVHEKQGHLDTALRYYKEGLDIQIEYHNKRARAAILINISNVYQLQGKAEEALRQAIASWHIRNKLFEQGEISEVYVGWSLTSMGTVYYQMNDTSKAYDAFQDALDIFMRRGHKRGQATINNSLGKLSMDQGDLPYAQQWFEKAHSTALNIDIRSEINSLNKLGWIFVLKKQYEKAIDFLQQAINLAKEAYDDYQRAESLVDLAETFKRSGQDEESQRVREEAEQICQQFHYYYLLGLSSLSEGDVLYEAHKHKEAFVHYGEACYYMTQYNQPEYGKALRKLYEALLEVSPQKIDSIVDELVLYWSSQGLGERYPDFISTCEDVRGILIF